MAKRNRMPLTDDELTEFLGVRLEGFNRGDGRVERDHVSRMAGQFGILQSMFIRLINGEETPAKMLNGIRETIEAARGGGKDD